MGQHIVRRKKGRPSKADLATRRKGTAAAEDKEVRRSLRRRNVKYVFDFDDYLDDDEFFEVDDDQDDRRRQKKLNLLLKLNNTSSNNHNSNKNNTGDRVRGSSGPWRVHHAPATSASSSSDDDDDIKPSKKRRINGDDDEEEQDMEIEEDDENDDVDDDNEIDDKNDNDDYEARGGGKAEPRGGLDSASGALVEVPSGLPLPDKKKLVLILDKLQKKDIYGVYADPVDPEELPDYHDVIEHPMDFATVRNKLGNGSYRTMEQFESDVFLICANAMQYNGPDTIYYKQARSIQELAQKKFHKLRVGIECSEKELKSEQKTKPSSISKKQIKKTISRTVHEPLGSDFSSGATLATAGELVPGSTTAEAGGAEKPTKIDGHAEDNPPLMYSNLDKIEESLPGKGSSSRYGRKSYVLDENRRATFNTASPPVASCESVLSTFEGESKHLVPVGINADQSYARSIARFAATLGPVAWEIASKRIEEVLPPGFKFGRGWVGEYEPLPTPVVMFENRAIKEPTFFAKSEHATELKKNEKISTTAVSFRENPAAMSTLIRKSTVTCAAGFNLNAASLSSNSHIAMELPAKGINLEGKPFFLSSPESGPSLAASGCSQDQSLQFRNGSGPNFVASPGSQCRNLQSGNGSGLRVAGNPGNQHQDLQSRNLQESGKVSSKQVELNSSPAGQGTVNFVAEKQIFNGSVISAANKLPEMDPKNRILLPSQSFRQSNINGVAISGFPDGKFVNSSLDSDKMAYSSAGTTQGVAYFPHSQEQGLSDPVQLMRMIAEKGQNQQQSSTQSFINASSASSSDPLKREDSSSASAAAARAWMSIGAAGSKHAGENTNIQKNQISASSLYNPARELHPQFSRFRGEYPGIHSQPEKNNIPLHAFVTHSARTGKEIPFPSRPVGLPQFMTADLSRSQMQQPPWQSLNPQMQARQRQESLPPDLNIGFQPVGSPGRPSSGSLVDSQQPDLALQL